MGGNSVFTSTQGIKFADGTQQNTAAAAATPPQTGVVVFTGGTASSFVFTKPFVASTAPVVILTPLDGVDTHSIFWSMSVNGTNGNWTGFTVNLSGALFGAFNFVAYGSPN